MNIQFYKIGFHVCVRSLLFLLSNNSLAQTIVSGRIVDLEMHRPMENVFVEMLRSDSVSTIGYSTWTDAEGRYRFTLPTGNWRIQATYHEAANRYRLWSPALNLSDDPLLLNFELPTALKDYFQNTLEPSFSNPKTLSVVTGYLEDGRIIDADGIVLQGSRSNLSVEAEGILNGTITHGGEPAGEASILLHKTVWQTTADSVGRFRIEPIDPGRYRLRIRHNGETLDTPPLEITAGLNDFHIDMEQNW